MMYLWEVKVIPQDVIAQLKHPWMTFHIVAGTFEGAVEIARRRGGKIYEKFDVNVVGVVRECQVDFIQGLESE